MSQISSTTSQQVKSSTFSQAHSIDDLTSSDFLQLMITQMQQQDPLNPMDNNQMVQQINSLRSLSATTALTSTLNSVQVGQNISTASGMIGKSVTALTDDGTEVTGKVDSVSVAVNGADATKRDVRVHIGDQEVQISNIREILQ